MPLPSRNLGPSTSSLSQRPQRSRITQWKGLGGGVTRVGVEHSKGREIGCANTCIYIYICLCVCVCVCRFLESPKANGGLLHF